MNRAPNPHQRATTRFIRQVGVILFARYSLGLLTAWAFLSGVVILALRTTTDLNRSSLLWSLAGLVPCLVAAAWLTIRRVPDHSRVRVLLDREGECGGLLMSSDSLEIGKWQDAIPEVAIPRLQWQSRRLLVLSFAAIAFLIAGFLAPVRSAAVVLENPLNVAREVEETEAKVELLKEEEIVTQEEAESFESQLDALEKQARGDEPARTWEALDHIQDSLVKKTDDAVERMAQANANLASAEALSEALANDGSELDSKLMAEAMKELSNQVEQGKTGTKGDKPIPSDLAEGLKSGSLSKEQLKQLAEALKGQKGSINESLKKLRERGMIDLKKLKGAQEAGKSNSEGLAEFLKEHGKDRSVREAMGEWGRGGVDRGRGDAPMTWTDPSSERGAKFKEEALPPASVDALKESRMMGLSSEAPQVEKNKTSGGGALAGTKAGGGSGVAQTVLPRHRGAVKRYFERK